MPKLAKRVLSQFVLSGCMRRLRYSLYPTGKTAPYPDERLRQDMPAPTDPRPGFGQMTKEGRIWEATVYRNLLETFGVDEVLIGGEPTPEDIDSGRCFSKLGLLNVITGLRAGLYVTEPEFSITETFKTNFHLNELSAQILLPRGDQLGYAEVRPDIIQVTTRPQSGPWYRMTGLGQRELVSLEDSRLGLRVIDIKLTAEPSPAYFAEIALYSMVLADWLIDNHLDDRFFVDARGAVWPGKHEGSTLACLERNLKQTENRAPTRKEAEGAVEEDLEELPNDIFTGRVRRFLLDDLRDVLEPLDWRTLDWHVSNRCSGCEYLGYRWTQKDRVDDRHCWVQAEREGHLSRVTGITLGARRSLHQTGITTIRELAAVTPGNRVFERHHSLRMARTALTSRAQSLGTGTAAIIPRSGTSASLPQKTKVKIYLGVEFDRASDITISFGWRSKVWNSEAGKFDINTNVRIVEKRSLECERQFLLQWLDSISRYIQTQQLTATIQFYLWDEVSYEHLARVYGRHLDAILSDPSLGNVHWLFPPESVLEDARYQDGKSPLTIVQPIVKSSVTADIPHYYNLIQLATMYYPDFFQEPPKPRIRNFFMDPLSDHVPSERAHEIWSQIDKPVHYQEIEEDFRRTVRQKLELLDHVVTRLSQDLPDDLRPVAPTIDVLTEAPRMSGVCWDGQIWHEFTSLNSAISRFENEMLMAMPPHEREARFKCIRLEERITGTRRREILSEQNIPNAASIYVFKVRQQSIETKLRPGDFVSLMPEDRLGFAKKRLTWLRGDNLIDQRTVDNLSFPQLRKQLREASEVKIISLNLQTQIIVVECNWPWSPNANGRNNDFLPALEADSILAYNFNLNATEGRFAIIDPLPKDFIVKRVENALNAIKDPPLARTRPLMPGLPAHIQKLRRRTQPSAPTHADRFIWDADNLALEVVGGNTAAAQVVIDALIHPPTDRQLEAIDKALTRRLFVLWGPPGTGKSETASAIILSKAAIAHNENRPLRILLTGPTWVAIDTVFRKLPPLIEKLGFNDVNLVLTHSSYSKPAELSPAVGALAIPATTTNQTYSTLLQKLHQPQNTQGITIVGATAHQVQNIIKDVLGGRQPYRAELFDFVLVDESSQVDVPTSLLFMTALAENACMTVVGDNLQMPPIHKATVPEGCKNIIGSLYDFYTSHHGVQPVMLDRNFRSNQEIVEFTQNAGYETLHAHHPHLRVHYPSGLSAVAPEGWPDMLVFDQAFSTILDAESPLVCIIHQDGMNAQSNKFEAQVTAALVRTLYGTLSAELSKNPVHVPAAVPYAGDDFFKRGVGIVTPHKAQQAEVIRLLEEAMPPEVTKQAIRNSVDTVERFQGQEKDVMIATFALGDPDAIALEEEFIFGLERFNVIASRAKAKMVVLVSRELADHLPSEVMVMRSSRLLKRYIDGHLQNETHMDIPFIDEGTQSSRSCLIRT